MVRKRGCARKWSILCCNIINTPQKKSWRKIINSCSAVPFVRVLFVETGYHYVSLAGPQSSICLYGVYHHTMPLCQVFYLFLIFETGSRTKLAHGFLAFCVHVVPSDLTKFMSVFFSFSEKMFKIFSLQISLNAKSKIPTWINGFFAQRAYQNHVIVVKKINQQGLER